MHFELKNTFDDNQICAVITHNDIFYMKIGHILKVAV